MLLNSMIFNFNPIFRPNHFIHTNPPKFYMKPNNNKYVILFPSSESPTFQVKQSFVFEGWYSKMTRSRRNYTLQSSIIGTWWNVRRVKNPGWTSLTGVIAMYIPTRIFRSIIRVIFQILPYMCIVWSPEKWFVLTGKPCFDNHVHIGS